MKTGVCVAALLLSGCAVTIERDAHLYPANDLARAGGIITAHITSDNSGHGPAVIDLPTGEHIVGEFSILPAGAVGFGSILGELSRTGDPTAINTISGMPGIVAGFGGGVSIDCEFYNNGYTAHGTGACRTSAGALYRMQY